MTIKPILRELRKLSATRIADWREPNVLKKHLRATMRDNWQNPGRTFNRYEYRGRRTVDRYKRLGAEVRNAIATADWCELARLFQDNSVLARRDNVRDLLTANGFEQCAYDNRYYPADEIVETRNGMRYHQDNVRNAGYEFCEDISGYSDSYSYVQDLEQYYTREHTRNNFYRDPNTGNWYSDASEVPPPEPSDNGPIYEYNEYYGRPIGACSDKYQLGFEMEMEFPGDDQKIEYADDITSEFTPYVAHCKRDGSLGSYGVETVTGYGDFADIAKVATTMCRIALSNRGLSHMTETCGHHVSISRRGMTTRQVSQIVVFFNLPENQGFIAEFARRRSSRWASVDGEKSTDSFITDCVSRDSVPRSSKYEAVNLGHSTHLEVRVFRGSLRDKTVIARLALVRLVAEYCESSLSAKDLRFDRFVNWVNQYSDSSIRDYFRGYMEYRSVPATVTA